MQAFVFGLCSRRRSVCLLVCVCVNERQRRGKEPDLAEFTQSPRGSWEISRRTGMDR